MLLRSSYMTVNSLSSSGARENDSKLLYGAPSHTKITPKYVVSTEDDFLMLHANLFLISALLKTSKIISCYYGLMPKITEKNPR